MRKRTRIALAAAAGAALATVPAAVAEPLAGTYAGKGPGVKATVDVNSGGGTLSYTVKTTCGKRKGALPLSAGKGGSLKGKVSGGASSVRATIEFGKGGSLEGSLAYRGKPPKGETKPCKAKRTFAAALDATTSPEVRSTEGHYTGMGEDGGLPISFDVAYDPKAGGFEISNMAFDTSTDCYDAEGLDLPDPLVVHVSGLSGEVDSDGAFEIDYTPDEDTDYYVEGELADGEASMDLEVGGYFLFDGTPLFGGPDPDALECDSWGETYDASRA
jgi:hypothetical protein